MKERRAYQLLDAAEVVKNLGCTIVQPATESQARPLTRLEPEVQREVWQEVVANPVANALLEIRDSRLYRQQFPTFEAYCRERWGIGLRYSNRLIAAAEVVGALGAIAPMPATESQARPLTRRFAHSDFSPAQKKPPARDSQHPRREHHWQGHCISSPELLQYRNVPQ